MSDVNGLLDAIHSGNPGTQRNSCRSSPTSCGSPRTDRPMARVHEACLRLVDEDSGQHETGRGHFFAAVGRRLQRGYSERD